MLCIKKPRPDHAQIRSIPGLVGDLAFNWRGIGRGSRLGASIASEMATEEKATLLVGQNHERSASPADPEHAPEEVHFHRKASESSFNWIGCFCMLGILVFLLAVLGAMFGAGVVVGRGTVATGNTTAGFDWGGNVIIDGKNVAIISWFDGEMSADNIKKNLE